MTPDAAPEAPPPPIPPAGATDRERVLLEDFLTAYLKCLALITDTELTQSGQAAFEMNTRIAEYLRMLADHSFEQRPAIATRILEAERLSLTGLATKIGVSKARANQMVQQTRAQRSGK